MNILVVNDDGIEARGIELLAEVTARHADEVYVVAPRHQNSAMSQRITIRGTLEVRKEDFPVKVNGAYSVTGTPADCVKASTEFILKDKRIDYVFSGINFGFNTGYEIAYSGTIGAAMEALMKGYPAAAFSADTFYDYRVTEKYIDGIIEEILSSERLKDGIYNVNFPTCPLDDCHGILRDRVIEMRQYFQDYFEVKKHGDVYLLDAIGRVDYDLELNEDSDLAAVLDGYVSMGIVRCNVFAK